MGSEFTLVLAASRELAQTSAGSPCSTCGLDCSCMQELELDWMRIKNPFPSLITVMIEGVASMLTTKIGMTGRTGLTSMHRPVRPVKVTLPKFRFDFTIA